MTYWALLVHYEQVDIEVSAEPDGIYAYFTTGRGCTKRARFTLRHDAGAWVDGLKNELTGPPALLDVMNNACRYLTGEWWREVAGVEA